MSEQNQVTCWVVTDGRAGMENQCIGLAQALSLQPTVKRIVLRSPWKQLSPYLQCGLRWAHSQRGDSIEKPWPDLLIASGRASVPAALFVRRITQKYGSKRTITVQIQNPVINPKHFDLVVTPLHDELVGENVLSTRGSMHRMTPELLRTECDFLRPEIGYLPRPYTTVVIGGPNGVYDLGKHEMIKIVAQLNKLARTTGGSLLVTPSRRTGEDNIKILQAGLGSVPSYVWDMTGRNPYFGMLGLADSILVTGDSVNLVSEACSTGKPVQIIELEGGSPKFDRFHKVFRDTGLTRPFKGELEKWSYEPLNDVQIVAERVKKMMQER